MAEEWERWIPVIEHLLWQCYYRVLSFISFHGPIDESYKAAESLSKTPERGGVVYWVVPDRVFRWDRVSVSPGIEINVWFFGSPMRRKNTVMTRVGWWTLTLFTETLRARAKRLGFS